MFVLTFRNALSVAIATLAVAALVSVMDQCLSSSDPVQADANREIGVVDAKIRRQIRTDKMWRAAKSSLRRSDARVSEAPSAARSMSLGAAWVYREMLIETIEKG